MSWQTYVDDHLMCEIEGNYLTSAAIIGHDGSVWAQSANFPQVSFHLSNSVCLFLQLWDLLSVFYAFRDADQIDLMRFGFRFAVFCKL